MRLMQFAIGLLVLLPVGAGAYFSDVPADYAYRAAIYDLRKDQVFMGYSDGRFFPFNSITRIELVHSLVKSLYEPEFIDTCDTASITKLNDVDYKQWYGNTLCTAQLLGIIGGYSDGNFYPEKAVSFAEAATIMSRSYEILHATNHVTPDQIWYRPYVKDLSNIRAIPITISSVHVPVQRGEIAEMMYRIRRYKSSGTLADYQYILFEEIGSAHTFTRFKDSLAQFRLHYPENWPEPLELVRSSYSNTIPTYEAQYKLYAGPEQYCRASIKCIDRPYILQRYSYDILPLLLEEIKDESVTILANLEQDRRRMIVFEQADHGCTHRSALLIGRRTVYSFFAECGGSNSARARMLQRLVEGLEIDETR